jgi:type II secretory pathway predicted ATPase ExeA
LTLGLIHERSAGIPRRINQICDFALLTGMNRQAEKITAEVVREAIDSLEK